MATTGESGRGWATRIAGLAAFLVPLLVYVATLAPTVTLEDSGEFITAAYRLGIPHPSGYPLWCLVAHAFTWLPWRSVAERVHLNSAAFGAATCWLVYLVALRLFRDWRPALVAALGLGVSGILWSQSVIAEVYSLNSFFTILLLYITLRWRDGRSKRWLYLLAFAVGLGLTNHQLLLLVALPIFLWILTIDARAFLEPRILAGGGALLLLGLSVNAYLPIRAAADPPINIGDPRTVARVIAHVRRDAYSRPSEVGRTAGSVEDVLLHTRDAWLGAGRYLGWPLATVAALGVLAWPRDRRDVLLVTLAIALCNTLLLNALLTAPHSALWVFVHRVYYIPTHAMAALWVASGASLLLRAGERRGAGARRAVEAALLLVISLTAWTSYPDAHRQGDHVARNLALDLLDSAPPGAGFLPMGDEVVYPVLYTRYVEGLRPDVHLISSEYGWHHEPYSMLLSGDALSDRMRADLSGLRDYVAVPRGVAWALVPRSAGVATDYASFVPLPAEPRDQGLESSGGDLFVDAVRGRYAEYHARLGARALARGDRQRGLAELGRAELLDPGDPHAEVLMFQVYRDFAVRSERLRPLLEKALTSFDRGFDPHNSRYDPLGRREIEDDLASLSARAEQ